MIVFTTLIDQLFWIDFQWWFFFVVENFIFKTQNEEGFETLEKRYYDVLKGIRHNFVSKFDFYTPANKVWGGGYTVGGRSYPESSCSSIHFFCLKTKNFQTQNFWKLQFNFI